MDRVALVQNLGLVNAVVGGLAIVAGLYLGLPSLLNGYGGLESYLVVALILAGWWMVGTGSIIYLSSSPRTKPE